MTNAAIPSRAAVVIIGGGMAGLSCASALAREGVRDVVLLEAKTLAHAGASSFGESRMFREMYSDPVLCQLAQEANRLWRQEEDRCPETLRATHGLLFYGESWEEETIEGSIPGARRVMDAQGIPYEALSSAQIAERLNRDQMTLGVAASQELRERPHARLVPVAQSPQGGGRAEHDRVVGVGRQGDDLV